MTKVIDIYGNPKPTLAPLSETVSENIAIMVNEAQRLIGLAQTNPCALRMASIKFNGRTYAGLAGIRLLTSEINDALIAASKR